MNTDPLSNSQSDLTCQLSDFSGTVVNRTVVLDSFAEAFPLRYSKLLITAADRYWLEQAVQSVTGYGTSVIGCDCEVGLAAFVNADQTPDRRLGAEILIFAAGSQNLGKATLNRAGQCIMTCPSTSLFDVSESFEKRLPLGSKLRFFGDGFQKSKVLTGTRYWRIPVMDGEFVVEDEFGVCDGVAGGNLIFGWNCAKNALKDLPKLVEASSASRNVILPFPGGAVRSGSKVGSKYPALLASTAHSFCPLLKELPGVKFQMPSSVECVYEIVIDGCSQEDVASAMKAGIEKAVQLQVPVVTAGNYGGKLGPYHFKLNELLG